MNGRPQIPQLPGDAPAGDGSGGGDIDLGQTPPEPIGQPLPAEGQSQEPTYPSVMLQGGPELAKIPDEGRMLVHHKVTSRRIHTPQHGRHKGKVRHEVEVELHKARPMRGYKKAASKRERSADENAMRKLMGDNDEEE